MKVFAACVVSVLWAALQLPAQAADWPQWAGSPQRNNVSTAKKLPDQWNVGEFEEKTGRWLRQTAKNVRWVARLGSQTYGTPIVADGKVFCGTNNKAAYLKRYPAGVDLGCLLCFQQNDGGFCWQLSRPKLPAGDAQDYREQGICCAPLAEGKRLWLVTNRCEVLCLATDAASDHEANILWSFDMAGRLGVVPHNMSSCSVTAAGGLLLVNTSNGVDESHRKVPAPAAPSFIALDRETGKLVWSDSSPGRNILHGQWASPAYAVMGGVPQAVFAGGDGWLYSFRAAAAVNGKPELLWKFDCNPKTAVWKDMGQGDRATLVATPMIHGDRVYIATGEDPEFGEGPGVLWCIDGTKRGDVSAELVFDRSGKPAAPRRLQAADLKAGDVVRRNANSAVVWRYAGRAAGKDDHDFKQSMHRTLSLAVVHDDLLLISDLAGLLHCLDAKTGQAHWTYDTLSQVWGTPLVADGKVFLGDEDGDVAIFACAPTLKLLAKNAVGAAVYTSLVAVDDTLYVATRDHLIAIAADAK